MSQLAPTVSEHRVSSQIRRAVRDGVAVYEKQYLPNDWDDDADVIRSRAQREVQILRRIADGDLFRGRLGVVRIVDANPEAASISTREIEGVSLGKFIDAGKDVRTNLMPWFLAGRWLRQFQSLPLTENVTDIASRRDPDEIVDYCDLRLRSISDYGYNRLSDATRMSLLSRIEQLRDQQTASGRRQVWVHADYSPGNLMWDGRVLTPIDFAMVRSGDPLGDATYLIHRIEMHRVYRPWLRIPVASMRRAVLRGLGVPEADGSAAYQMLMIKHHICRLHTYVRRPPKSFKQSLHDRWVRSVLLRRLRAYTS